MLEAVWRLERSGVFAIDALSSLYETAPVGISTTHPFINVACLGRTAAAPRELLELCKGVERELGRGPAGTSRDRPIDIDILLFGLLAVAEPDLLIPHPRMRERRFVLVPLAEIAPDLPVPPDGCPVRLLRDAMAEDHGVTRVSARWLIR